MAQSLVAKGVDPGPPDGIPEQHFWPLVFGCVGVVYGDIGTSPLYAFREAVGAAKTTSFAGREAVFGVLSLILWSLLLVVTLKYVVILLRADNKGEGGMFALDGARPIGRQAQRARSSWASASPAPRSFTAMPSSRRRFRCSPRSKV